MGKKKVTSGKVHSVFAPSAKNKMLKVQKKLRSYFANSQIDVKRFLSKRGRGSTYIASPMKINYFVKWQRRENRPKLILQDFAFIFFRLRFASLIEYDLI